MSNGGRARPMSSSPRRMPSTCAPVTRSDSSTSTSGSSAVRRRSSGPRTEIAETAVKPSRTTPGGPGVDAAGQVAGAVDEVEQPVGLVEEGRPGTGQLDPAVVALEQLRADRASPASGSARLSGGWVIDSRSAARPKCSSSATATKQRTWSRVITTLMRVKVSSPCLIGLGRASTLLLSVGGHTASGPPDGWTKESTCASRPPCLAAALGAASLALTACGGCQTTTGGDDEDGDYPSGTVEMYVGADPGGSSDLISRAVSKGLSDELGASFPVINKPGANGALAAAELAKAEPDGSTIAIQNASLFAITPLAVAEDEVTSIDDFDVVQGVSRDDYVMVANPDGDYRQRSTTSKAAHREGHLRHHRRRHRLPALLRAAARQRRRRGRGRAVRRRRSRPDRRPRRPGRHRLPAGRRGDREHRVRQDRAADRLRLRARRVPARRARPPRSRASTSRSRSTAS